MYLPAAPAQRTGLHGRPRGACRKRSPGQGRSRGCRGDRHLAQDPNPAGPGPILARLWGACGDAREPARRLGGAAEGSGRSSARLSTQLRETARAPNTPTAQSQASTAWQSSGWCCVARSGKKSSLTVGPSRKKLSQVWPTGAMMRSLPLTRMSTFWTPSGRRTSTRQFILANHGMKLHNCKDAKPIFNLSITRRAGFIPSSGAAWASAGG